MTNEKFYNKFSIATQTCGTNEVLSPCGNDGCRPTCARRDTTGCVPICSGPACVCATGFVRNSFGTCVTRDQCREYLKSYFESIFL